MRTRSRLRSPLSATIRYLIPFTALLLVAMASPGCQIYIEDDEYEPLPVPPPDAGPDPCRDGPGPAPALIELRDPFSGQCIIVDVDLPICDPRCGPCPAPPPLPTWGPCLNHCSGLDELSCLVTSDCRAGYIDTAEGRAFHDCWATDSTGPLQGQGCDERDAWDCSRYQDCVAVHRGTLTAPNIPPEVPSLALGEFAYCAAEPAKCNSADDCQVGESCDTGDTLCLVACDSATLDDCPCTGICRPATEPEPDPDPGLCYGEVFCDGLPPDCPGGTVPGIDNGCWSGACIALADCEDPPLVCADIAGEDECVAAGCQPVYRGEACTCDPDCSCERWIYQRCD